MWKLIARSVLLAIPTLFAVATVTFLLVQLIPGSPGRTILGETASEEQVVALNAKLGFDRPVLVQYGDWLLRLVTGDLGTSLINQRPVMVDIAPRLPVTLTIALGGVLLMVVFGLALGILGAVRGGWIDRTTQVLSGIGMAVPSFWLGVVLVLVFAVWLGVLPPGGWVSLSKNPEAWFRSLVLPVVAVGVGGIATIARQARGSMIDVLGRDYIKTLRASGASSGSIIFKHGLRNASIPVVANVGFRFVGILGGAVVIEQVFAVPGIGKLTLDSVYGHDLPMIQAIVLCATAVVLAVNLLVDIASAWLNPKLRTA